MKDLICPGAGIFGSLSDSRLGRKGTLALVCILNTISGILTAFSPNFWTYFALRTATGFSAGGLGLCSFVLATESVGPNKRGPVGMSTFYFFSGGIMLLSGLALLTSSWRHLCIIISIPSILYCILVIPFLNESPRWYLVQGRTEDAMRVLASIASRNRRSLPEDITVVAEKRDEEEESVSITNENLDSKADDEGAISESLGRNSLLDVFKAKSTRARMLIMVFVWLTVAMVYYGISLNVTNLSTNLYLSVFLNAVAEVPAFVITSVFFEKYGRRYALMITLLVAGFCCLVGVFAPGNDDVTRPSGSDHIQGIIRFVCGLVAIFGMAGAYNLLYIYTAELFPTVVRNAALGLASQAAQIGAILAPIVVVLGKLYPSLPYSMFSGVSFMGAILALKLPETVHCPMYETFEGMQRGEIEGG